MTETENKSFFGKLGDTISEKWASLGDNQAIFVIFAVVLVLVLIMAIVSVRNSRKSAINAITDELDELAGDIREAETLENAQKIIYTLVYALFASTLVSYLSHRSINKLEPNTDKVTTLTKTIDKNQADLLEFVKDTTGFGLTDDAKKSICNATIGVDSYADGSKMTTGNSPVVDAAHKNRILLPLIQAYAVQKGVSLHLDLSDRADQITNVNLQRAALLVVYEALTEGQDQVVKDLTIIAAAVHSTLTHDKIESKVDKLKDAFLKDDNGFNKTKIGDSISSEAKSDKDFTKLNFKDAVTQLKNERAQRTILAVVNGYAPKDEKYVTITKWNGIFVNPLNGDGLTQKVGLFLQDVIGIVCFPFSVLDYIDHTLVNVDTWYINSKETMGLIQHSEDSTDKHNTDKPKKSKKD